MKSTKLVIATSLLVCMVFSSSSLSFGQLQVPPKLVKSVQNTTENPVTIVETIYGVNRTTGKIVAFATMGRITEGKVFDASMTDQNDKAKDGIVEVGLTLSNVTVKSGEKFRACIMVLNSLQTICEIGHKAPSPRAEFVGLVINENNVYGQGNNNTSSVKVNVPR